MKIILVKTSIFLGVMSLAVSCSSTKENDLDDIESDEAIEEQVDSDESADVVIEEEEILAAEDYENQNNADSLPEMDSLSPESQVASTLEQLDEEFEDQGPVLTPESEQMDTPSSSMSLMESEYRVYYATGTIHAHDTNKTKVPDLSLSQGDRVLAKPLNDGWLEGQDGYFYKESELSTAAVGRQRTALGWNG